MPTGRRAGLGVLGQEGRVWACESAGAAVHSDCPGLSSHRLFLPASPEPTAPRLSLAVWTGHLCPTVVTKGLMWVHTRMYVSYLYAGMTRAL